MENKIIGIAISAAVVIILLGAFLVPVISDAVDENTLTKTNDGIPVSPVTEWSAEFLMSDGVATASVNGESVTVTQTAPMYVSDNACIIFNSAALILYYYDSANGVGKNISAPSSINVTVADGSTTFVVQKSGETTITFTDAWAYMYDPNGAMVSKYIPNSDTAIFFNDLGELRGSFQTVVGSPTEYYSFVGDQVTINGEDSVTATVTQVDTSSKEVKSCVFNRNASTSGYTFEWNSTTEYPLVVIAPHVVTGALDDGIGNGAMALLLAIPVLIIVGLVVMVIRNGAR